MKELEKMTYEELSKLMIEIETERYRRDDKAPSDILTLKKKYQFLRDIELAFNEYYKTYQEYPLVKYRANFPAKMNMAATINDNIVEGSPFLMLWG